MLCGSRSCGCAIKSDSLSVTGSGTRESPWQIEAVTAGSQLIETSHVDAAARNAAYPAPENGQPAWLRNTRQSTRWDSTTSEWLVMQEPWTAYTPAWTTSGTAAAINNGTIVGRYQRTGKTCRFRIHVTTGSSTTFGTGYWWWSLPFTASSTGTGTQQFVTLKMEVASTQWITGVGYIASGDTRVQGWVQSLGVSTNELYPVGATIPGVWTHPANFHFEGFYEIA